MRDNQGVWNSQHLPEQQQIIFIWIQGRLRSSIESIPTWTLIFLNCLLLPAYVYLSMCSQHLYRAVMASFTP